MQELLWCIMFWKKDSQCDRNKFRGFFFDTQNAQAKIELTVSQLGTAFGHELTFF